MTNAMLYQDVIQGNVSEILHRIKDNGGKAPGRLVQAEYARLQGSYAAICVNIALLSMGRPMAYGNDGISGRERDLLVERARKEFRLELHEISVLRAPKPAEFSVREAAARLGVSLSTIYRRIHAGKVQVRRVKQASGRWQYM